MHVTAEKTQAGSAIRVIPTDKPIGADIAGVDLTKPLSDAQFQVIFDAWMDRYVLRFRGQGLSKEQLLAFSARFGELDKAPINVKGGRPSAE